MLLLISPAKTLDFTTPAITPAFTQPDFLPQSQQLIQQLRRLAPPDIARLMGISDKLAILNCARFDQWATPFTADNAKQALFAFQGDVYTGMAAENFSAADIHFAQRHLRILSGLYGLLRPLDLIQAYRLEMGTALSNARGKNLYEFWGNSLTEAINRQLAELRSTRVINLASNEYFGAVKPSQVNGEIITPVFKEGKNGQYKIVSFFAKKARGLMSAYIIQQQITEPENIKQFALADYRFNSSLSSERNWVFTRNQA